MEKPTPTTLFAAAVIVAVILAVAAIAIHLGG